MPYSDLCAFSAFRAYLDLRGPHHYFPALHALVVKLVDTLS